VKKQTVFNLFVYFWLLVITVWLVFLTVLVLGDNYEETLQKFGFPSDIDSIMSQAVQDGKLSPELKNMVQDLIGDSPENTELPHSKVRN
jgi:hypothetical protein